MFFYALERMNEFVSLKEIGKIFTAWKRSVFGVVLVCIFLHSNWIRRDTEYLSIFSPNAGKYGPEKFRIWALFTQWFTFLYFYKNGFSQPITKCLKNIEKKDYLNLIFIVTWKLIIIQKISPIIQNLEQALFHYLLPSFP